MIDMFLQIASIHSMIQENTAKSETLVSGYTAPLSKRKSDELTQFMLVQLVWPKEDDVEIDDFDQ